MGGSHAGELHPAQFRRVARRDWLRVVLWLRYVGPYVGPLWGFPQNSPKQPQNSPGSIPYVEI